MKYYIRRKEKKQNMARLLEMGEVVEDFFFFFFLDLERKIILVMGREGGLVWGFSSFFLSFKVGPL